MKNEVGYSFTGVCYSCDKKIKASTREKLDDKFSKHCGIKHLEPRGVSVGMSITKKKNPTLK